MNNLDLVLVDPAGNEWYGNNLQMDSPRSGQSSDAINNVERIKSPLSSLTQTGQWLVLHRGGND